MIPRAIQMGLRLGLRKADAPKIPIRPRTKPRTSSLLQYAIDGWTLHTTTFRKTMPSWDQFEYIALRPNTSWRLHPWPSIGNTQNSHIRGLFGYAAAHNHQPLLQLLVDQPTLLPRKVYDEVLPGNDLLPALHVAAKSGHSPLIPMLLKLCSINSLCPLHRQTALHVALSYGHDEFALALCGVPGAKLDVLDVHGVSPLALALRNVQVATFRALLASRKVNLNSKGNSLIHHERRICRAIYHQIHHRSVLPEHQTLLHDAIFEYSTAEIQMLLANQMDVNVKNNAGRTPLHCAVIGQYQAIVKLLLANNADVKAQDEDLWTPLHHAAPRGGRSIVSALLRASEEIINWTDAEGRTALNLAVANNNGLIMDELLKTGKADVNSKDSKGNTPLHGAVACENYPIAMRLLRSGADVNAKNSREQTPLHKAVAMADQAIVTLLLGTGHTNVYARDIEGRLPLHFAAESGNDDIVEAAS